MLYFPVTDQIEFYGGVYSMLEHPDADSLVRAVKRRLPKEDVDKIRKKAEKYYTSYYEEFGCRFGLIGDPRGEAASASEESGSQAGRKQES